MSADRPAALPDKVAAALDRLARARRTHRQATATRNGLTPLQVELLTTLADGSPPQPLVGLLAEEVGVAQPTATDSLAALERKGLISRRPQLDDRRRSTIGLTADGRRLVGELVAADRHLADAVAELPEDVQAATLETLLTLIARLVDDGTISTARTCLTCAFHRHDQGTHRCTLLDVDLPGAELRVNCPEHEPAAAGWR